MGGGGHKALPLTIRSVLYVHPVSYVYPIPYEKWFPCIYFEGDFFLIKCPTEAASVSHLTDNSSRKCAQQIRIWLSKVSTSLY